MIGLVSQNNRCACFVLSHFVFEFTVGTRSQSTEKSWKQLSLKPPLKEMYHKIETNDDGDISMKHVVIHIKGDNCRVATRCQAKCVFQKCILKCIFFI